MNPINIQSKDNFLNPDFHWFTGVVEDIHDPQEMGRVRVRCIGYHTEHKDYIPSYMLPWATVMLPPTTAGISEISQSATGLERGSWVIGFFRDGANAQDPIVIGVISSIATPPDYEFGFSDPTKQLPYKNSELQLDAPKPATEDYKVSWSYRARNAQRTNIDLNASIDDYTSIFPQVSFTTNPQYPRNNTIQWRRPLEDKGVEVKLKKVTGKLDKKGKKFLNSTEGGEEAPDEVHTREVDTTRHFERITDVHGSGTFREWDHIGNEKRNVKNDSITTIERSKYTEVAADNIEKYNRHQRKQVLGDTYTNYKGIDRSYHERWLETRSISGTVDEISYKQFELLGDALYKTRSESEYHELDSLNLKLNKEYNLFATNKSKQIYKDDFILDTKSTLHSGSENLTELFGGNSIRQITGLRKLLTEADNVEYFLGTNDYHLIGTDLRQYESDITKLVKGTSTYNQFGEVNDTYHSNVNYIYQEDVFIHIGQDVNDVEPYEEWCTTGAPTEKPASGNRTTIVELDDDLTVNGNRFTLIELDHFHTVNQNRTVLIEQDDSLTVNQNRSTLIELNETRTVNGQRDTVIEGDDNLTSSNGSINIIAEGNPAPAPQAFGIGLGGVVGNINIGTKGTGGGISVSTEAAIGTINLKTSGSASSVKTETEAEDAPIETETKGDRSLIKTFTSGAAAAISAVTSGEGATFGVSTGGASAGISLGTSGGSSPIGLSTSGISAGISIGTSGAGSNLNLSVGAAQTTVNINTDPATREWNGNSAWVTGIEFPREYNALEDRVNTNEDNIEENRTQIDKNTKGIGDINTQIENDILPNLLPSPAVAGSMAYFDGNDWVQLEPGSEGGVLRFVNGRPQWDTVEECL